MEVVHDWRYFSYYVFGLAPALFFGLRFLFQWISSEQKKRSYVGKSFWYLSLCGNCLLAIHYFVQMQYLLLLLQVANGFISWRNLNLLKVRGKKINFQFSLIILFTLLSATSGLFFLQAHSLSLPVNLLEIPLSLIKKDQSDISLVWHLFGAFGCVLFASRFWIQWLETERSGVSRLSSNFWIISILGSASAFIYFFYINDFVSCLNYAFGFIPYMRNLMLIKRKKTTLSL